MTNIAFPHYHIAVIYFKSFTNIFLIGTLKEVKKDPKDAVTTLTNDVCVD